MMGRLVAVVIVGLILIALFGSSGGDAKEHKSQVRICHFESHTGPESPDFVTYAQTGLPLRCLNEGGAPMWVSRSACENGHGAIDRFGKDCNATD